MPNACTSSAPKEETPASETQIGLEVTARISSIFLGHSLICQWFQSSGNPWMATISTASSTPWEPSSSMKLGSMGEIPPSAMGSSGFSLRIALLAVIIISANIFHSGSSLKSQCERLFGSFHNMTASIMYLPFQKIRADSQRARQFVLQNVLAVLFDCPRRLANPGFLFRMGRDFQS